MAPSKDWSILRVTYPHFGLHGEQHVIETPSKQAFQRRFAIIDPFQKPYLAGHVQRTLQEAGADIKASGWVADYMVAAC